MSTVFEILQNLETEKWSGEVDVTSSQGHATILIREGKFVWAHRPLDHMLEKFKTINWIQLPDPELIKDLKSWPEFVTYLLNANPSQYGKIVQLLKIDRLEVFFRIFFWTNIELMPRPFFVEAPNKGTFGFYSQRDLARLLTEAKMRLEKWPQIKQKIGSSKRVFVAQVDSAVLNQAQDLIEQAVLSGKEESPTPFSSEEVELLKACDGHNSVQDIVRLLPYGEYLVLVRILDLWRKGALRPKDDEHSVVSIHAKTSELQLADFVSAGWMVVAVCLLYLALSVTTKLQIAAPQIPVEVMQALDIYYKKEGRYPLTLSDLPEHFKIRKELFERLRYAPTSGTQYELELKQKKR